MTARLTAGSEIDAWCTRCRMDLGHRIVAMVGTTPKRVICLTCDSQHNYRAPKGASAPTPKARRSPRSSTAGSVPKRSEWDERVADKELSTFTQYSIDKEFTPGELVLHRKFGPGYVAELLGDGKVSIMFKDGARVLATGMV